MQLRSMLILLFHLCRSLPTTFTFLFCNPSEGVPPCIQLRPFPNQSFIQLSNFESR